MTREDHLDAAYYADCVIMQIGSIVAETLSDGHNLPYEVVTQQIRATLAEEHGIISPGQLGLCQRLSDRAISSLNQRATTWTFIRVRVPLALQFVRLEVGLDDDGIRASWRRMIDDFLWEIGVDPQQIGASWTRDDSLV